MSKNEEKHWNTIADSYDSEVQDVYRSNRKGRLQRYIRKYSNKKHHVIDFGCGTGNGFAYISPAFKSVTAVDISQRCLDVAKSLPYSNITLRQADLTKNNLEFPKADVAICCNVAILPDADNNFAIIRNIQQSLKKKGVALLVVPSVESILLAGRQMIRLYGDDNIPVSKIPSSELAHFNNIKDVYQGLVNISGVLTKHYTKEELKLLLSDAGLRVKKIDKLEYNWKTEFDSPPKWMKAPYPWDWLVVCKNG